MVVRVIRNLLAGVALAEIIAGVLYWALAARIDSVDRWNARHEEKS